MQFYPVISCLIPFIIIAEDPTLGKLEKSTMSQQTLMELSIEGIMNKVLICGSSKHPKDLIKWKNFVFDDMQEVIKVNSIFILLQGSIALQWLPSSVTSGSINGSMASKARLTGTLDLTALPGSLEVLKLNGNRFRGEICLTKLPEEMEYLDVSSNRLSGLIDLTALPGKLGTAACY